MLEALSSLYRSDFVGVCEVRGERGLIATLYFVAGRLVHASMPDRADALGHVLCELSLIDLYTYRETMTQARAEQRLHGQVLLELKLIDELRLNYALSVQLHRKLRRIFSNRDARYTMRPDAHLFGADPALRKMLPHPRQVIYLAARMSDADTLVAVIKSAGNRTMSIPAKRAAEVAQFGLGAAGAMAAARILEVPTRARQLLEDESTRFEVGAALTAMMLGDFIELGPEESRRGLQNVRGQRSPAARIADDEYDAYEVISHRVQHGQARATVAADEPRDPVRDATAEELRRRMDTIENQNHFEALGVQRDVTTEAIRAAFVGLAKRFHPDRITALGLTYLTADADRFCQRLSEARATLSDPEARARYVALLDDTAAIEIVKRKIGAERSYQRGEQLLARGDLGSALDEFERAFANNTEESDYRASLAWCRFLVERERATGEQDDPVYEAKALLWSTIKRWPEKMRAYLYLSRVLVAGNASKLAVACLRKAAVINPEDHEIARELRLLERRQEANDRRGMGLPLLRALR
jgi:hypothetical protein